MGDECIYCSEFVSHYPFDEKDALLDDTHRIFHQPCQRCDLWRHGELYLCMTCQHMRLDHLVHCGPLCARGPLTLRIGLSQRETSLACRFCRLVHQMIKFAFGEEHIAVSMPDGWTSHLVLKLDQSNTPVAHISIDYKFDQGSGIQWIGNLHISDAGNDAMNMPCIGAGVNWDRMRDVINHCAEHHADCRTEDGTRLPLGFRLIDVARRSIVEKHDVLFVALSYVWGKDTRASLLTATRSTINRFRTEGGLLAANMPKTIEDAMKVCVELGIDYLWADRLCIIQDDPEDKMNQIMAMSDIYKSASLVLAITHGDNMDFGIYGVSRLRPTTQLQEVINGLRFTSLDRRESKSPLAVWDTRGWTYQEAVCARRLLGFTSTQAYYHCQVSGCHEDMRRAAIEPGSSTDRVDFYVLHLNQDQSRLDALARHIEKYTSRKLSFSSDVYNAFMGIANLLYNSDYSKAFLCGLPMADFGRALLWFARAGTKPTSRVDASDLICPSWSWASAMIHGQSVAYLGTPYYGGLATWIAVIQDFERSEATEDEGWQIYMKLAEQEGCTMHSKNPEFVQSMNELSLQDAVVSHSRTKDSSDFCMRPCRNYTRELREVGPGHLVAIAEVASFRVAQRLSMGLAIVDSANMKAGELAGEVIYFEKVALALDNRDIHYEFVALSLSGLDPFLEEVRNEETKKYRDGNGSLLDMIPIVDVLLIERKGRIVHRKELGWIYLKDWARAERHWETIILG